MIERRLVASKPCSMNSASAASRMRAFVAGGTAQRRQRNDFADHGHRALALALIDRIVPVGDRPSALPRSPRIGDSADDSVKRSFESYVGSSIVVNPDPRNVSPASAADCQTTQLAATNVVGHGRKCAITSAVGRCQTAPPKAAPADADRSIR